MFDNYRKINVDVRGSVRHSIIHIKIEQNATVSQNLFEIYMKLNVFRATRPTTLHVYKTRGC